MAEEKEEHFVSWFHIVKHTVGRWHIEVEVFLKHLNAISLQHIYTSAIRYRIMWGFKVPSPVTKHMLWRKRTANINSMIGATLLIFGQRLTRWKKDALVAERCALIGWSIHVNIDSLKNKTIGGPWRHLLAVKITSNWQRTDNAIALTDSHSLTPHTTRCHLPGFISLLGRNLFNV